MSLVSFLMYFTCENRTYRIINMKGIINQKEISLVERCTFYLSVYVCLFLSMFARGFLFLLACKDVYVCRVCVCITYATLKRKTEKVLEGDPERKRRSYPSGTDFRWVHRSRMICLSVFNYLKYLQY